MFYEYMFILDHTLVVKDLCSCAEIVQIRNKVNLRVTLAKLIFMHKCTDLMIPGILFFSHFCRPPIDVKI